MSRRDPWRRALSGRGAVPGGGAVPRGAGGGLIGPAAVAAVLSRPALWPVALRVLATQTEPGWWRSWPPLPRLPEPYARFRRQTMWGADHAGRLGGSEAVEYLRWVELMRRSSRPGR